MKCILWTTEGGFLLWPFRILQYSFTYQWFIPQQKIHTSFHMQVRGQLDYLPWGSEIRRNDLLLSHISASCDRCEVTLSCSQKHRMEFVSFVFKDGTRRKGSTLPPSGKRNKRNTLFQHMQCISTKNPSALNRNSALHCLIKHSFKEQVSALQNSGPFCPGCCHWE